MATVDGNTLSRDSARRSVLAAGLLVVSGGLWLRLLPPLHPLHQPPGQHPPPPPHPSTPSTRPTAQQPNRSSHSLEIGDACSTCRNASRPAAEPHTPAPTNANTKRMHTYCNDKCLGQTVPGSIVANEIPFKHANSVMSSQIVTTFDVLQHIA